MGGQGLRCAGALIFDSWGRLFVQRRSAQRSLFPNCWDIVGGHLEPGESALEAMRREVAEETGWEVTNIHAELEPMRWRGDDGKERLEFDFLVSVAGDLENPALERDKHSEWKWITADETELLDQHRRYGDSLIKELVQLGFDKAQEIGLSPSFAAIIAAKVDRAFIDTMTVARQMGGKDLSVKHGLTTAGPLIDYRLILPGRPLRQPERDVINRYSDPRLLQQGLLEQQEQGTVTVAADGTVTATAKGQAFYRDLWKLHAQVAGLRLRAMPVLAKFLEKIFETGTAGGAFAAVYPPYLPGDASAKLRAFAGLAALRYQRADAHAAAWAAQGLTAEQIVAMPRGSQRESIEAETNRIAMSAYRDSSVAERFALLHEVSEVGTDL